MHAGRRSRRERSNFPMALELANAPQDKRIGEMSAQKLRFVLVNDMAPRRPSVCTGCSRPLERGYLHDLFRLKALLRDRVLPRMDGGEWIRRIVRSSDAI